MVTKCRGITFSFVSSFRFMNKRITARKCIGTSICRLQRHHFLFMPFVFYLLFTMFVTVNCCFAKATQALVSQHIFNQRNW